MTIDNTYTLINQIVFDLKFDDDTTKTVKVSTGDVVTCAYTNNGLKQSITGRVDRIGINSNCSLGHIAGSVYIRIDGSEAMDGNVVYIRPAQVLDMIIVKASNDIQNPICSVSNDGQTVIMIRENEVGVLQYTKNGTKWVDISNGDHITGLSAFEVAVKFGFTGTEDEWLESLKGAKGDKGDPGKTIKPEYIFDSVELAAASASKVQIGALCAIRGNDNIAYLFVRSNEAQTPPAEGTTVPTIVGYVCVGIFAQGPVGPEGPVGPQGEQGEKGEQGNSIHVCTQDAYTNASIELKFITGANSAKIGDILVDTGGDVFEIKDINDKAVIIGGWLFTISGAGGKSAYQIAIDNGFIGTEAEWVASLNGKDGLPGAKGDKGDVGPQGPIGETGPIGPGGGEPGAKGDKGDPGIDGLPGAKGDKGDPGEIGPQGLPGPKGDKGDKGDIGPSGGVPGADGAQGPKGDKGDPGPIGPQGIAGEKGADGLPGAKGDIGPIGPQGLQGIPGEKGADGLPGAAGADGAQGPKGDPGINGTDGISGAKGDKGDVGPIGPQGLPGEKGADGVSGTPGVAGKSAYDYAKEAGYAGTEAEFGAALVKAMSAVTLADVKALGYAKCESVTALPAVPDPETVYFVQTPAVTNKLDEAYIPPEITPPANVEIPTEETPIVTPTVEPTPTADEPEPPVVTPTEPEINPVG